MRFQMSGFLEWIAKDYCQCEHYSPLFDKVSRE